VVHSFLPHVVAVAWPRVRTVGWIGSRTVRELVHHLFDNRRLLAG